MPVVFKKWITRVLLRERPDDLFVFGDNIHGSGRGGQAKEMRGEPNAVGLPTKLFPNMKEHSFLRDSDLQLLKENTDVVEGVARLTEHLKQGGTVVWPKDGIGTGLAELPKRAPKIKQFYDELLENLQKIDANSSAVRANEE